MSLEDVKDFLLPAAGVLIVSGAIAYGCSTVSCSDTGAQSGLPTKFSIWSGCYVQIKGKWVPAKSWREIEDK